MWYSFRLTEDGPNSTIGVLASHPNFATQPPVHFQTTVNGGYSQVCSKVFSTVPRYFVHGGI
jgi:hypothetical protein